MSVTFPNAEAVQATAKHWLRSKTLWFNAISIGLLFVQWLGGRHMIADDTLALIIAAGNFLLRTVTVQPLTTGKS